MKNGIGIATRVLLINSVISIFAFVAQIASLVVYGPTHSYWMLYLTLVMTMFTASLVAQWVVRKSLFAGMNFYAWVCFACVAGMVCIDAGLVHDGFPMILFTLVLGVLGLGLTVGYSGAVPYGGVCAVTMIVAGVLYEEVDSAIVAAALMAATAAMASESARMVERLNALEDAVGAYIDAKRELRQDTATHQRGSG